MNTTTPPDSLQQLNQSYQTLNPTERLEALFKDQKPEDVLVTSSFGTTAVLLLHHLAKVRPQHPVYFIDTTYHFKLTLQYKEYLTKILGLNVIDVQPNQQLNQQTQQEQMWNSEPDKCCHINKVMPLEPLKQKHKIWVSGLLAYQSQARAQKQIFEQNGDLIKFYPLLDAPQWYVKNYFDKHKLPPHPLLSKGFESVGCTHCTVHGKGREGRWANSGKTECGLHHNYNFVI